MRSQDGEHVGHPSVRVIRRTTGDATRPRASQPAPDAPFPTAVRPTRVEDLRDVADLLRTQRAVVLELERLDDRAMRRRALDVAAGIAYGLETSLTPVNGRPDAFLLDPARGIADRGATVGQHRAVIDENARPTSDTENSTTCVLCDLRAG